MPPLLVMARPCGFLPAFAPLVDRVDGSFRSMKRVVLASVVKAKLPDASTLSFTRASLAADTT